jgi:hypothetical protein
MGAFNDLSRRFTAMAGRKSAALLLLSCLLGLACGAAQAQQAPQHLRDAQALLGQLDLANTHYEHGPGQVLWQSPVQVHTDCSGLVDHLLMHSYGYTTEDLKRWLGSHRPTARRYYDTIQAGKGFTALDRVTDLQPGDVIAVKYLHRTDNTGHIMLVAEPPQRIQAKAPLVDGTAQWQVSVIDSAESGHGTTDTRHKRGAGGKDHDGLGQGVIRLYTDHQGQVAGFAWSVLKVSEFRGPDDEPVVLGRLAVNFKP